VVRRRPFFRRPAEGSEPDVVPALEHLMVVGGTVAEWDNLDDAAWRTRVDHLADVAREVGARWVTVHPLDRADAATDGAHRPVRTERAGHDGITVVIDPESDARARVAAALTSIAAEGVAPDRIESRLGELLCHAPVEPDLAVILGPSDRLPVSVSWELAYAEMVFLDVPWGDLNAMHLREAVEHFRHRARRFGGVDS
jgi:undecaprenyl pyrophosphate synthase